MRAIAVRSSLLAVAVLAAAGCGGSSKPAATSPAGTPAAPHCAYRVGWQRLANRIGADVYCPAWLPPPLFGQIGSPNNNINQVSPDRSYLESFIWQDTDTPGYSGLFHVILRGYPGRSAIPSCLEGMHDNVTTPCYAQPNGLVSARGIHATLYTVNQDADAWHLVLLWHHRGGLYTVSEHLAPPLDYRKVVAYLKRELGALVLIAPSRAT